MTSWPLVRLIRTVRARAEAVDRSLAPSYFHYLCDTYGFVSAVAPALWSSPFAAMRVHARATALADELRLLGGRPDELARIARDASTPVVLTASEALGWLFVVERACLQASRLRGRLQYGRYTESDQDRDEWLQFGRQLMVVIASDDDMKALTRGALAALDSLEDWSLVTAAKDGEPQARIA